MPFSIEAHRAPPAALAIPLGFSAATASAPAERPSAAAAPAAEVGYITDAVTTAEARALAHPHFPVRDRPAGCGVTFSERGS